MTAARFTARAPLFRVIPGLEFHAGQWTPVVLEQLSDEQVGMLATYYGSHVGVHPEDESALGAIGFEVVAGRLVPASEKRAPAAAPPEHQAPAEDAGIAPATDDLAPAEDPAPAPAAAPPEHQAPKGKGGRKRG